MAAFPMKRRRRHARLGLSRAPGRRSAAGPRAAAAASRSTRRWTTRSRF